MHDDTRRRPSRWQSASAEEIRTAPVPGARPHPIDAVNLKGARIGLCALPSKAIGYAKYDLVRALNRLVDAVGLRASRFERILARTLEVPASRFLRTRLSVDLLVSASPRPGKGAIVEGPYQTPILIQWRPAAAGPRELHIALPRIL